MRCGHNGAAAEGPNVPLQHDMTDGQRGATWAMRVSITANILAVRVLIYIDNISAWHTHVGVA